MRFKKSTHKKEIVRRINKIAKQYKEKMVGKSFLVMFEGMCFETVFKIENFLHLCGVDTSLYAKDFYKKALMGNLKHYEIDFSNGIHPYKFADIKTRRFEEAISMFNRDSLVITNVTTITHSYMLGTTDLNIVICFDSQYDKKGNEIKNVLVPYSLRVEEISNNRFDKIYQVDYVLSKKYGMKQYNKIEFGDYEKLEKYMMDNNITQYNVAI